MRVSWLSREVYYYVDRFYMQQTRDAERIIRLGANPDQVFVSGNLKFDFPSTESANSLKELFGQNMHETGKEGGEISYDKFIEAVHRVQMNTFWNTTKGKNIANKGGLKKKKADDDDD